MIAAMEPVTSSIFDEMKNVLAENATITVTARLMLSVEISRCQRLLSSRVATFVRICISSRVALAIIYSSSAE